MLKYRKPWDMSVLLFLWKVIISHKKWALACLLSSVASTAASLSLAFFTKQLVTQTVNGELSPNTVWVFVLLVFASAFVGGVIGLDWERM